ncbi:hypothetical protein FQZ97_835310 [compost metagenome]
MPVAALAVGQVGIDGRVVEVHDFLARVAGVVLLERVHDGQRRAGAVALHHVARALVHGRAQRGGGFLRAELVVDADDLELHAGHVLLVEFFGQELEGLELVGTDGRHQARQRVQPRDLDGLTLLGKGTGGSCREHGGGSDLQSELQSISPGQTDIKNAAQAYKSLPPHPSGNARKEGAAKARIYRAGDSAFPSFATRR